MAVEPLIFELSKPGRRGVRFPEADVPETPLPAELMRDDLDWPEVSEIDVIRHFTRLSPEEPRHRHRHVPARLLHDEVQPEDQRGGGAAARLRPHPPATRIRATVQGALELMYELQEMLGEISGFDAVALQPAAGAHGELTGVLIDPRLPPEPRRHGAHQDPRARLAPTAPTRRPRRWPASRWSPIPSDARGNVDLETLRAAGRAGHRRR